MDQAILSFQMRFEQFEEYEKIFGFLFDPKKLKSASDDDLKQSCINLESYLKHGKISHIDANYLFLEFRILKKCFTR